MEYECGILFQTTKPNQLYGAEHYLIGHLVSFKEL
jgi:hypothetical protein